MLMHVSVVFLALASLCGAAGSQEELSAEATRNLDRSKAAFECATLAAISGDERAADFARSGAAAARLGYPEMIKQLGGGSSLGPLSPFILEQDVGFWIGIAVSSAMSEIETVLAEKTADAAPGFFIELRKSAAGNEFRKRNCSLLLL